MDLKEQAVYLLAHRAFVTFRQIQATSLQVAAAMIQLIISITTTNVAVRSKEDHPPSPQVNPLPTLEAAVRQHNNSRLEASGTDESTPSGDLT